MRGGRGLAIAGVQRGCSGGAAGVQRPHLAGACRSGQPLRLQGSQDGWNPGCAFGMAWVVVGRRSRCRVQYASAAQGGRRQRGGGGGGAGHHCPAAAFRCLRNCYRPHRRGLLDCWSGWAANGKPKKRYSAVLRGLLPTDEEK